MKYELLQQLKSAHFPFKRTEKEEEAVVWSSKFGYFSEPTLSELIEAVALPLSYFSLEQHSNEWRAGFFQEPKMFRTGPTPDVAIAKLWLALNPKEA